MKVLFLIPSPNIPSSRFRVYQYLNELDNVGIEYDLAPSKYPLFERFRLSRNPVSKGFYYSHMVLRRLWDAIRSQTYDVVFLQREVIPHIYPIIPKIIKFFNKRLVFDFDDAIWAYHTGRGNKFYDFLRYDHKIQDIIRLSSNVIVGNNFLAEFAREYNDNVSIIPTPVEMNDYKPRKYPSKNDKTVIGWTGSDSTNNFLNSLTKVRRKLEKRYDFAFTVVSNSLKDIDYQNNISFVPWDIKTEVSELQKFDIGIMPMEDNIWNKGKCNLKVIQYMGVAVTPVCSPVGMNNEIIQEGITGFLPKNDNEWISTIGKLIEDPSLRQKIGLNARKLGEDKYSVRANAPHLIKILEETAG